MRGVVKFKPLPKPIVAPPKHVPPALQAPDLNKVYTRLLDAEKNINTISGLINSSGGSGGLPSVTDTLTVSGVITSGNITSNRELTVSGLINANGGLTVASGKTLDLTGATVVGLESIFNHTFTSSSTYTIPYSTSRVNLIYVTFSELFTSGNFTIVFPTTPTVGQTYIVYNMGPGSEDNAIREITAIQFKIFGFVNMASPINNESPPYTLLSGSFFGLVRYKYYTFTYLGLSNESIHIWTFEKNI